MRIGLAAGVMIAVLARAVEARASVTIRLEVDPPRPVVGQPFHVIYEVQASTDEAVEATALDMGRLQVVANLGSSRRQQFTLLPNGSMGGTTASTFQYLAMAPSPGRYTISGARATDQTGRVVAEHPPIVLDVRNAAPGSPIPPAPVQQPQTLNIPFFPPGAFPDPFAPPAPQQDAVMTTADPDAPPAGELNGADFNPTGFIRYAIDNATPYVGQEVILRAWLYVPANEAGCEPTAEPGLDGFWSEPLLFNQNVCARRWTRQTVGGHGMASGLVRKIALYPTHAGALRIGTMGMNVEYMQGDMFFGTRRQVEVHSPDLAVTVQDAPAEGRPAGYIPGTVGVVTLQASVDRPSVPVGETVTVTVVANGNGYLGSAGIPTLAPVDGLRIHSGASEVSHRVEGDVLKDTLTNRFLVVATRPGSFSLGALDVDWFDAATGRYQKSHVVLPTFTATGAALTRDEDETHPDPATEISAYEPSPALRPHRAVFITGLRTWGSLAFPPVALIVALGAMSLRRTLRARRVEREASTRTDPTALLVAAQDALAAGKPADAVDLAGRALERAHRDVGEVSIPRDTHALVAEAQALCDTARFSGVVGDAAALVDRVRVAVEALERVS